MIAPSGVCVIQMSYSGSPAAIHDGMPLKYSTDRSNTLAPVERGRGSRADSSGVIQFSRPISSSGPTGSGRP